MQTQVEFRSAKFPPYEGEEEEINLGLWGRRLTEHLARRLAERGIETEAMVIEDWGCYLPVRNEGFPLALCCGHQDGDDDQFLVFTEPSTPKVKKFFRTIDATAQLTRLLGALRQVLESDPEIREIVWRDPSERRRPPAMTGVTAGYAPHPNEERDPGEKFARSASRRSGFIPDRSQTSGVKPNLHQPHIGPPQLRIRESSRPRRRRPTSSRA